MTVDVFADGSRRPGGTAFYSALQAARLGQRALIVTRGVERELRQLLEPYAAELEIEVHPAESTTTLRTSGEGAAREQRMLSWAGPMGTELVLDTDILHLAPVARETSARWGGRAEFVGLTPQGLVRTWKGEGGRITSAPLATSLLPRRCQAIVFSQSERESCAELIDRAQSLVAVTAAGGPTEIHLPGGEVIEVPVVAIEEVHDDLGAGDVFAAAFFIALAEQRLPQEAASFANAAAAVRIAGVGASAIGDRNAIRARARQAP